MDVPSRVRVWFVAVVLLVVPVEVLAQDCQTPLETTAQDRQVPVISGYGEVFGTIATEDVGDGALPLRGFDNRVNTFAVSNLVLSARFRCGDRERRWGQVGLDVVAQVAGTTPTTYYLAEPSYMARDGVGATNADIWRFVQQATVSWRRDTNAARGRYWLVEAGIFLSPIGPEGMAVKDNWNWSRSNLFYGLPFYHTGIQLTRGLAPRWRMSFMVMNGWNSVVDNNDEKTLHLRLIYDIADRFTWTLQVMSGVERSPAATEGRVWRSLADTFVTWHVASWLSLQAHVNAGIEPNALGAASWAAGAAYARVRPWPGRLPGLSFAARWDAFYERTPEGGSSIFWPTSPSRSRSGVDVSHNILLV